MPDPKDTSKWQRTKKVLWDSNINAPVRGFYNLMNSSYDDLVAGDAKTTEKLAGDSLDVIGSVTAGSAFAPKPRGAITAGVGRKPFNVEGAVSKAPRAKKPPKLSAPKTPTPKTEAPSAPKNMGKGTFLERMGSAKKSRGPFPVPAIRKENLPSVKKDSLPSLARKEQRGVAKYRESGVPAVRKENLPAVRKDSLPDVARKEQRTFGDKGRVVGLSGKGKAAAVAAASAAGLGGYAAYQQASKPKAETLSSAGGKTDKPAGVSAVPTKSDRAKAFRDKMQGRNKAANRSVPAPPKKASDKSRLKPLTNFERTKMRSYEKDSVGRGTPKSRVMQERGFKFKDLFKR